MAFIYCDNCRWGQDDFWSPDGYNPFRPDLINDLKDSLFKDKIYIDEWYFKETGLSNYSKDEKGYYISGTDFVAHELERKAKNIKHMVVKTNEEWKKIRDTFVCPECGSDNIGMD